MGVGTGHPINGPTVTHKGPTHSHAPKPGKKPPPPDKVVPRDGFVVAFGPIAGLTDPKALAANFYFQVPPMDSFPAEFAWVWNDYGTIDSGMHSNPNYKQLTTITFDSMFVLEDGVNDHLIIATSKQSIFDRARTLKALGDSLTPFAVQVGSIHAWGEWEPLGPGSQQQMAATLRGFRWESRAGEPDTRYFNISITEFADAGALTKIAPPKVPGQGHTGATVRNGQKIQATLVVTSLPKNLRTLAQIAKNQYGSASAWRLIAKASGMPHTGPNEDLRVKFGSRKPPTKIYVPVRAKSNAKSNTTTWKGKH
jgi:hypothetical protein